MVSVPVVIHLGDSHLAGPLLNTTTGFGQYTGIPFLFSSFTALPKLMLAVPHEIDGGLPNWGSAQFYPWWEGHAAAGVGLFLPYHHIPGVFPTSGGSVWYGAGNDTGAPGVGSDAIYMHAFHELWAAAPYFKAFKFGGTGGICNAAGFKAGTGTTLLAAAAEYGRAVANMASNSYEPDVKVIILDASAWDIEHWATAGVGDTYFNNLVAAIADIRTRFNAPDAKVLLISHSPELWQLTSPGAAIAAREHEKILSASSAGIVGIVDMLGSDFAPLSFGSGADLPGYDKKYYSVQSYLTQGAKIAAVYDRMANPPATVPGIGLPVYFLIGDSQITGGIPGFYVLLSRQASILGPGPGPVGTRAGQWIYNGLTHTIENYHPLANSNTAGTIVGTVGPDITLMDELAKDHPDGVLLVKLGMAGSGLTDPVGGITFDWRKGSNGLYQTFLALAQEALAAVVNQVGIKRIPDVRGMFFGLGDNDTMVAPELFQANLLQLFSDLRDDLTTRTDHSLLPMVYTRVVPVSALGSSIGRAVVYAAASSLAASDTDSLRMVDTDDFELSRDDNIHWGNEAVYTAGRRYAAAMREIVDSAVAGAGDGGGAAEGVDFVGGGVDALPVAEFIVEDGTGLEDANSYATVAEFLQYHANHGGPAEAAAATETEIQDWLRRGSRAVDARWRTRFDGHKKNQDQAFAWPREDASDEDSVLLDSDVVPRPVRRGAILMALYVGQGIDPMPNQAATGEKRVERSKIGPLEESIEYQSGSVDETTFPLVEALLRPVMSAGGGYSMSRS